VSILFYLFMSGILSFWIFFLFRSIFGV
jgi:hypothetical protein